MVKDVSKKDLMYAVMSVRNGTDINEAAETLAASTNRKYGNDMGVMEAKNFILFAIGIIIFAAILPSALSQIHAANTSGWSAAETGMWGVIRVVVIGIGIYRLIE